MIQSLVRSFHEAFGLPETFDFPFLAARDRVLRVALVALLEEKVTEYRRAEAHDDIVRIADELADIVYVAYGTAVTYGIDRDPVLHEVHASNMTKIADPKGGKVLKGANVAPDVKRVLGP